MSSEIQQEDKLLQQPFIMFILEQIVTPYQQYYYSQAEKKDKGEQSDRSHSQSRSSSSDKIKNRSLGGHYRRLGVVSMPPEDGHGQGQEAGTIIGQGRVRAEVARRISLDDLSAAFQGEQFLEIVSNLICRVDIPKCTKLTLLLSQA